MLTRLARALLVLAVLATRCAAASVERPGEAFSHPRAPPKPGATVDALLQPWPGNDTLKERRPALAPALAPTLGWGRDRGRGWPQQAQGREDGLLGRLAVVPAPALPGPSPQPGGTVNALLQHWSDVYRLEATRVPASGWSMPVRGGNVNTTSALAGLGWTRADGTPARLTADPAAPHLEDCSSNEQHIDNAERRGSRGEDPYWAIPSDPRPPWVRGDDRDNLAGTRHAQRDIWLHQFPPDPTCKKARFLVVTWASQHHGIGSQIHLMGNALNLALAHARVLVPLNASFHRAQHGGCATFGRKGSFDCYWAPTTSKGCEQQAMELMGRASVETREKAGVFREITEYRTQDPPRHRAKLKFAAEWLASDEQLVYVDQVLGMWWLWRDLRSNLSWGSENQWGRKPWTNQPSYTEDLNGFPIVYKEEVRHHKWLNAQSTRFLLRWPSLYMCHLTNRARHQAFGRFAALSLLSGEGEHPSLWPDREPYMPRPILNMHVRQGDKGREMNLIGVDAFFRAANRMRRSIPDLKYIWLSTEMETVIKAAQSEPGWRILYLEGVSRQKKLGIAMWEAELSVGLETHVGHSFCNLVIASDCDHFIETLGSNWNRLIDELRKTNGRYSVGFTALNDFDE